jgi:hypothetical protein
MKKLEVNQMENLEGGRVDPCSRVTGGMCFATIALLSSTVFAPLAAATGIGCAIGLYGCK